MGIENSLRAVIQQTRHERGKEKRLEDGFHFRVDAVMRSGTCRCVSCEDVLGEG